MAYEIRADHDRARVCSVLVILWTTLHLGTNFCALVHAKHCISVVLAGIARVDTSGISVIKTSKRYRAMDVRCTEIASHAS